MKKPIILVTALLLPVTAGASGIPTVDIAGIVQRAAEYFKVIKYWKDQTDDMKDQYNQLKDTYASITEYKGFADTLTTPMENHKLPDDWQDAYEKLLQTGEAGLAATAVDIFESNKVFDSCALIDAIELRTECEYSVIKLAQDASDIGIVFGTTLTRLDQVTQLQEQIKNTEDLKATAELQARLQSETAMISANQMKLDALMGVQEANRQLQEQRRNEFAARSMAATQGTQLAPLTF